MPPTTNAEYLRYRLKRAGVEREIFTADAVALLHEAASGGMRDLDRLATSCLREAPAKSASSMSATSSSPSSTATAWSATRDRLRPLAGPGASSPPWSARL